MSLTVYYSISIIVECLLLLILGYYSIILLHCTDSVYGQSLLDDNTVVTLKLTIII